MTRILIDFRAEDEDGVSVLRAINSIPRYTPERAEMEAQMYMTLARCAWREADRLRAAERRRTARTKR